jgi:hypothetical protein
MRKNCGCNFRSLSHIVICRESRGKNYIYHNATNSYCCKLCTLLGKTGTHEERSGIIKYLECDKRERMNEKMRQEITISIGALSHFLQHDGSYYKREKD